MGIIFTLVTYELDRRGQKRADERQAREELAQTIGEIEALPRAYLQMIYSDNPSMAQEAYSHYNGELIASISRAEDILADDPDIVDASDVYVLGNAQLILTNFDLAIEELAEAEKLSVADQDSVVATAARRAQGLAYFGLERLDDGRSAFERAVLMSGFDETPDLVVMSNAIISRSQWVGAELAARECAAAVRQFVELERVVEKLELAPLVRADVIRSSVDPHRPAVEACRRGGA